MVRVSKRLGLWIAVGAAVLGCSSEPAPIEPRRLLRGIFFSRTPVAADSVRLATFGQVVSIVRSAAVAVLLTNADGSTIVASPGYDVICQSLGQDSSAKIEVEVGAGPQRVDSAAAIVAKLGQVHLVDSATSIVDGIVPAYRLHELDDYSALTYVYVVVCPASQAVRAKAGRGMTPPN